MRLDIRYTCRFDYADPVRESQNVLRVCPASNQYQQLVSYRLTTSPSSRPVSYIDYWGTRVDGFGIREPHNSLEVVAEAAVDTSGRPLVAVAPPMDSIADPNFRDTHSEYLDRSPHASWNDEIARIAREEVEDDRDVVSATLAIHRYVASHLTYQRGSTYVGVEVADVLAQGEGVCQDYAHLAVAMCRSVGIPARYVSGYLFTTDDATGVDPDTDVVEIQTHAWFETAVPGFGWMPLDPTNQQEVGPRHVKIGHGRDYEDVSLLQGVYAGAVSSTMTVGVEMRRSQTHQTQHAQQ